MSLFQNVIGSKTNFVRTDKNNTLTGENTFNGVVNLNGIVNGLEITDIQNLQTELEERATVTQLESETQQRINADVIINNNLSNLNNNLIQEITTRENGDIDLQNNIEEIQTSLDLETQNRIDGDYLNQQNIILEGQTRAENDATLQASIALKLDEENSTYMPNYTKYCVDNRDDLHDIINSITNQASVVNISQGSFGGTEPLIINKQNIALIGQASTPAIVEFAYEVTTAITGDRIRMRYLSFDNVFNAGSSRSVYNHTTFNENVNILASTTAGYMSFVNCEFASGKTINVVNNFASVIFFINCNFSGAVFSLNQVSNQQVIFNNCAGFVSFPINATYAGINTLSNGYIQNTITKTILASGSGTIGQVLTSGGENGLDTWSTPSSGGGGSDVIKERFSRYCLGQTVSTSQGDITLPNITTEQNITTTSTSGWTDLLGSIVSYQPPAGSSIVEYELSFYASTGTTPENSFALEFYIDNVPQHITRRKHHLTYYSGSSSNGQERIHFKTTIEINGTTNNNYCFLNNWNSSKTLKLQIVRLSSGNLTCHKSNALFVVNPSPGLVDTIVAPLLTITAY